MVVLIDFILFLAFTIIILSLISPHKLSSIALSIIIYVIYGIVTGTNVLIETSPIVSILITAVVFSIISATIVQIMNRV